MQLINEAITAHQSLPILKLTNHFYWDFQKNWRKGCFLQTLDWYCVSWELLSASIADTLLFVNILVSGIFHGRFAQRLAVNKPVPDKHWWMVCLPLIAEQNTYEICLTQECLQIVRHLLWSQTTTLSLRNINPMFQGSNLCVNFFGSPSNLLYGHVLLLDESRWRYDGGLLFTPVSSSRTVDSEL